ncbi:MAG: FGGY family carbohydrate kinase, partial [Terracidiphilus sp.]
MPYILALDQGTTSSRAILFDESGSIAAVAQHEFEQFYPQPGWVEHDPMEILTSQLSCAVEVLAKAGARPRDVAAIGITNQRETVIVWDRATGKPIHPAIVWQDRRTAHACEALEANGHGDSVSSRTGLVLDPYFSGTKVAWILDHVPGARARADKGELAFGTVDSWLIWHLTSGHRHVTDVTNASRTLLYNIVKGEWDEELLHIFNVPASLLPEVVWYPATGLCAGDAANVFAQKATCICVHVDLTQIAESPPFLPHGCAIGISARTPCKEPW